ncbi:aga operon transcriptional repressor domain protein [Escherichia coli 2848050]|nr:aga operon transcriptional repressor domain protein [Escherichia coli 2848050]
MTWLNQLNGSFRNAAFHRGVQCAFSSTDGSTDGVVLSQINAPP